MHDGDCDAYAFNYSSVPGTQEQMQACIRLGVLFQLYEGGYRYQEGYETLGFTVGGVMKGLI